MRRFCLGVPFHEHQFVWRGRADKAEGLIHAFFPPKEDAKSHCPDPTEDEMDLAARLYREFGHRFNLRHETYTLLARRLLSV